MSEVWPNKVSHHQVMEYLDSYTLHHNLEPFIRFGCTVKAVSQTLEEKWRVVWLHQGIECQEEFDVICLCNGHYTKTFVPELPGKEFFKGEIIHSRQFRNVDPFINKNVVIVGMGTSGGDISDYLERSKKLKRLTCCTRKVEKVKTWSQHEEEQEGFIQKMRTLLGINNSFKTTFKPMIKCINKNGQTVYTDDSFETVPDDVIIYCTGYQFEYGFLEEKIIEKLNLKPTPQCITLYQHLFHPDIKNMFFFGTCSVMGSVFPVVDAQAAAVCRILKGTAKLVSKENMLNDMNKFNIMVEKFKPAKPLMVNPREYIDKINNII
ncbi:dimethylaniline monooxygenase [Acrasis kona]|uniref:Dimethylaniline monooxygenase n=1 Tax=Acrasis kona TaxID=1008807 RepID=A0AAW2Z0U2_9EUKA